MRDSKWAGVEMMPARRLGARTLGHAGFPQVARVAAEPRDRTRGRAFSARKNGQTSTRSTFPGNPCSNVDWLEHRRRMRKELTPRTPSISRDCPRLFVGAREPTPVRPGCEGPSRFSLRRAWRAVHDAPTDAHFIHVQVEQLLNPKRFSNGAVHQTSNDLQTARFCNHCAV